MPTASPFQPDVQAIIDLALAEDIGTGDVTSLATVPADRQASGIMLAKSDGVLSGIDIARQVFQTVDSAIVFHALTKNGDNLAPGMQIATISGPARSLLTAERTALNIVQRLSGV